jgi:hypothetical protein
MQPSTKAVQDLRFGVPPATKRGAAPSSWLDGLFSAECREVELPVSFQDSGKEFDLRASSLGCVGKIHEQHGDVRGQGRINAAPASSIARIVEHGASDFDLSVGKPPLLMILPVCPLGSTSVRSFSFAPPQLVKLRQPL